MLCLTSMHQYFVIFLLGLLCVSGITGSGDQKDTYHGNQIKDDNKVGKGKQIYGSYEHPTTWTDEIGGKIGYYGNMTSTVKYDKEYMVNQNKRHDYVDHKKPSKHIKKARNREYEFTTHRNIIDTKTHRKNNVYNGKSSKGYRNNNDYDRKSPIKNIESSTHGNYGQIKVKTQAGYGYGYYPNNKYKGKVIDHYKRIRNNYEGHKAKHFHTPIYNPNKNSHFIRDGFYRKRSNKLYTNNQNMLRDHDYRNARKLGRDMYMYKQRQLRNRPQTNSFSNPYHKHDVRKLISNLAGYKNNVEYNHRNDGKDGKMYYGSFREFLNSHFKSLDYFNPYKDRKHIKNQRNPGSRNAYIATNKNMYGDRYIRNIKTGKHNYFRPKPYVPRKEKKTFLQPDECKPVDSELQIFS